MVVAINKVKHHMAKNICSISVVIYLYYRVVLSTSIGLSLYKWSINIGKLHKFGVYLFRATYQLYTRFSKIIFVATMKYGFKLLWYVFKQ